VTAAFSNASLNGQYAFNLTDPLGQVYAAGSFVADGNGGLSQGILDFVSDQNPNDIFSSGSSGSGTDVAFTGNYQIGTDGRGALTLLSSLPSSEFPNSYEFVMVSTSEGRMISTNVVCLSGVLFEQDTSAFSNTAISGSYAFRLQGTQFFSTGSRPVTTAGVFTADGKGGISGTEDQNIMGSSEGELSFTGGNYSVGSNGRGTLTGPDNALQVYVISATKMIFVSTGSVSPYIASIGEADQQTGSPFSGASVSGGYTFAFSGLAGYFPLLAGQFTANGQNGTIEGEEDYVDSSPISTVLPFTGVSEVSPNGRGVATLDGSELSGFVFYLVSPSQAFLVSTDMIHNFTGGKAYGQGDGPFTIAGNYAFSFAGYSSLSEQDGIEGPVAASGQFIADGAGNIKSGTMDLGSLGQGYQLTGTYSNVDSAGRGGMTITTEIGGSQLTLGFAFYVTSSSEITLIGSNNDVLGSAKQQQ
jgi:hypothetical protein